MCSCPEGVSIGKKWLAQPSAIAAGSEIVAPFMTTSSGSEIELDLPVKALNVLKVSFGVESLLKAAHALHFASRRAFWYAALLLRYASWLGRLLFLDQALKQVRALDRREHKLLDHQCMFFGTTVR